MLVPLKVRGIGASRHKLEKFVLTALYIPGLDQRSTEVYACVKCKLHLVEGLKANILIGNNIFCTKSYTIKLASGFAHILSCRVTIVVSARSHSQFLKRNVLANATTFILTKSEALVGFWQIFLPDSCDFLFQLFP